jgi:hypothetical protein
MADVNLKNKGKVWRINSNSSAFFKIEDEAAYMASAVGTFIAVDNAGITFRGNTSFMSTGEGQRTDGLFINTPAMLRMIPSTIVTLIPAVLPIPPLGFVKTMVQAVQAVAVMSAIV